MDNGYVSLKLWIIKYDCGFLRVRVNWYQVTRRLLGWRGYFKDLSGSVVSIDMLLIGS